MSCSPHVQFSAFGQCIGDDGEVQERYSADGKRTAATKRPSKKRGDRLGGLVFRANLIHRRQIRIEKREKRIPRSLHAAARALLARLLPWTWTTNHADDITIRRQPAVKPLLRTLLSLLRFFVKGQAVTATRISDFFLSFLTLPQLYCITLNPIHNNFSIFDILYVSLSPKTRFCDLELHSCAKPLENTYEN